jgi:hypothetical protein
VVDFMALLKKSLAAKRTPAGAAAHASAKTVRRRRVPR